MAVPEPTLDEIIKAFCPDSYPYKCLKYGSCYNVTSFCDSEHNKVQPCFPDIYSGNTTALFEWCLDVAVNKSQLIHTSCTHACHAKFGCKLCSFQAEEVGQTVENVSSTICPQTKHVMTDICQQWNQTTILVVTILSIVLFVSIIVNVWSCNKKKYALPVCVANQGGGPVRQGWCCVNLQQRPAEEQEGNKVSPPRQRSADGVHKRVSRDPSTADNIGHRGTDVDVHHLLLRDIDDPLTNQQPHNNTNVNGAGSCRYTQRNSETALCSSSTSATYISDSGNASGASSNPDFVNQEIWDCQDPRENQSVLPVRQTATISEFE